MREKSLSLGQHHCREVSTMQGVVSSGARRQRKKAAYLLGLAPHWLNAPCVLLFFAPKRVCLPFGFWHPGLVRRKKPSPPEPPLRGGGVLSSVSQRSRLITRRFYASGCPESLPRQWRDNWSRL